jgi:hypothetical protein
MKHNLPLLEEVAGDVLFKGADKADHETPLSSFVQGVDFDSYGDAWVQTDGGKLQFNKRPLAQFVKDRLGGTPAVLNDKDLSAATKKMYITDKAAGLGNSKVVVRQTGDEIDAVLSESYRFFDNATMIRAITQAAGQNGVPPLDQLYVHQHWLDENARNVYMRVVSPENWAYRNGEDYYAAVAFSNNEVGKGSLQVQPALARVACFNYTIANSVLSLNHRYNDEEEVVAAIAQGFSLVNEHAEAMFEKTQQHKSANFNNPTAVFDLIADRLGFPTKVKEETMDYWNNEGEDPSVYGITQAVTWGVQASTDVQGRRKPKWSTRTTIEHEIWNWAQELFDVHQAGDDINEYVNASELVSKRKAVRALENWPDARAAVTVLEADGYR